MTYRAVIFDLFGTLVDIWSADVADRLLTGLADILEISKVDLVRNWQETDVQANAGVFSTVAAGLEHACRAAGGRIDGSHIAEAVRLIRESGRNGWRPRPDAEATLTRLRASGHIVGLISNCGPDVPELWDETPFAPLIQSPVFSSSAKLVKPDPRIYELACRGLGVRPSECLYVGDGASGELAGAAAVGMHPVLIRVPGQPIDGPGHQEARQWRGRTISALAEVPALAE